MRRAAGKSSTFVELRNAAGLNRIKPRKLATAAKALLKTTDAVTEEQFVEMIESITKPQKGWE